MLILTRRLGEDLKIGDDVTVSVIGINSTQVRLGIAAPKATAVHREEIYEKIRAGAEEALDSDVATTAGTSQRG